MFNIFGTEIEILNKILLTIAMVTATILAASTLVYAQDPSVVQPRKTAKAKMNTHNESAGRYVVVNGLNMFYEIHGSGRPLVLVHGGGSTIESTFGRVLP